MADKVVTKSDILEVIKSENMKPSDLFGVEQIVADPIVKGYAEDRVKERIGSEYQHRMKAQEELEKLKKDMEPEKKKLQDEIEKLKLEAVKTKTGSFLEKQKEERKLDDRQVKFVQKRLDRFNPSKTEDAEKEFSKYLDSELDEYKTLSTDVFGIEEPDPKEKKGGAEPGAGDKKVTDNKYLDPAQNPFIKTD